MNLQDLIKDLEATIDTFDVVAESVKKYSGFVVALPLPPEVKAAIPVVNLAVGALETGLDQLNATLKAHNAATSTDAKK
jgi:hypothetical protein